MPLEPSLGGLVPDAFEDDGLLGTMIEKAIVGDLILKGDIAAVKEAHKDSGEKGMQNFDDALLQLYKDGTITLEEAMSHADSRSNLEAKVNFGG